MRSSRKPLAITVRDAPISAATAIQRVATPFATSTRNTALTAIATTRFCDMFESLIDQLHNVRIIDRITGDLPFAAIAHQVHLSQRAQRVRYHGL